MEKPKVVLSNLTAEYETQRSRRSSIATVSGDRTRRSSIASDIHSSTQRTDTRRKPPMASNAHFQAWSRKMPTSFTPRMTSDLVDQVTGKGREASKYTLAFQPTYRTEPHKDKKFEPHVVKKIIDIALEEAIEGVEQYDATKCKTLSVSVCEDIKQKVKWLNYERYKLICVVYFGSIRGQEMRVASRCLWNDQSDNFATSSVVKGDLYAVAMMYGVYQE